jgi:uncharacterized protein (TIGR02145 family)
LYDWNTAKSACPNGWHLSEYNEWRELVAEAGEAYEDGSGSMAGKKLKAKSGWTNNGNGTDALGFSALPGGTFFYSDGKFRNAGIDGLWWTTGVNSCNGDIVAWQMSNSNDILDISCGDGTFASVRCVRN